jgi:hypothetical protein
VLQAEVCDATMILKVSIAGNKKVQHLITIEIGELAKLLHIGILLLKEKEPG